MPQLDPVAATTQPHSGDHGGKDEAGDGSVRRPADTQGAADADPVPDCQTV